MEQIDTASTSQDRPRMIGIAIVLAQSLHGCGTLYSRLTRDQSTFLVGLVTLFLLVITA